MKTKEIISIVIIVVCFGGAAVMGYLAFSGSNSSGGSSAPVEPAHSTILPYGTKFDFSALEQHNPNSKLFPYPEVNPSEVGLAPGNMVQINNASN